MRFAAARPLFSSLHVTTTASAVNTVNALFLRFFQVRGSARREQTGTPTPARSRPLGSPSQGSAGAATRSTWLDSPANAVPYLKRSLPVCMNVRTPPTIAYAAGGPLGVGTGKLPPGPSVPRSAGSSCWTKPIRRNALSIG